MAGKARTSSIGSERMARDASEWWEAIVKENGFRRFREIANVQPGDLIAIKYNDGSKDTGHIMVVDQTPETYPVLLTGRAWNRAVPGYGN